MKRILLFLSFSLILSVANGQDNVKADTLWKFKGVTALNFSQLSLTNWAAGGESSLSGNAMFNLSAMYQNRNGKVNWNNDLILGYGLLVQDNNPNRKTDDKIDFASKFGYKASKKWFYSGLYSFKTQFARGYDNPGDVNRNVVSNFMTPAYMNISFGMDYKPNNKLTILLAPIAGKMTIVLDDSLSSVGVYGVPAGENVRSEFGGYVKIAYSSEIVKNITLNTKIDLFSNYIENPQYVDVNFDLMLNFKVNKYISASIVTQLIYDYDIKFPDGAGGFVSKIQFKEIIGIGFAYSF